MSEEGLGSDGGQLPFDPLAPVSVSNASIHVFVSYASQDGNIAAALVEVLERHGLKCWIAPRDVDAGALYAEAIVRAIGGARAFVLVLSVNSIDSSHVGKEVERASSKKRPIIALRIDNAPLTPSLEYFLSESQWVEAQIGKMEPAYAKLIGAIRKSAPSAPGVIPTVTPSVDNAPAAHSKGPRNRMLLAAGLVVVVVALGALVAHRFWLAKHLTAKPQMTAATNGVSDKSIAVLPFADMSEKHDQEYFGDGMAEEILDLLTKIPGLTVIGRTSSFTFKGKNEDLRTIGAKLNAAFVLEGSVRKAGDQIRITVQLINTRTGAHEWSETYDRRFGDVLKLQDAIALAVARELQLTVVPADLDSRAAVKNAEAYALMLRGRHAFDRLDKDGFDEAIMLFQEALARDPTLADAASWLARAQEAQAEFGFLPQQLAYEQSRRMAALALKLDSRNAEAHAVLGGIHLDYDWDWAGAEREFQQAKLIAPGDPYVQRLGALIPLALGRWDDALKQLKAAVVRDPFDPINYFYLATVQERLGQLTEAESSQRRVLDISPTAAGGHTILAHLLLEQGDRDGAFSELQRETDRDAKQLGLAMVFYAIGRKAESDAALAWYIKEHAWDSAYNIADSYALRGQSDDAIGWLERAFTQKDPGLVNIKADTALVPLNGDPRYKALLRKMNLPE